MYTKAMYTKAMDSKIKKFIGDEALTDTITIINGECINGKILDGLHLVVKVNINLYESGFFNGDVCKVLGETEDGELVLRRLKDDIEGLADKNQVSSAEWVPYKF